MSKNEVQLVDLNIADMHLGVYTTAMPHSLTEGMVANCLDLIFKKKGFIKSPGLLGLAASQLFSNPIRLLDIYTTDTGTEILVCVCNSKVYYIDTDDGEIHEMFTIGGDSEAYGIEAFGKYFIANGTDVIKVEGTVAHKVGITAPAGVTAAAYAGGSLGAGVWGVYACYARKVGGTIMLYSTPQSVGNVTLAASDLTIRVTMANSAEAQVNDKVIFLVEPSGSTGYYYHETDNNTTTTIDITSNTNKNENLLLDVLSIPSSRPTAFSFVFAFDNRLWGLTKDSRIAKYSLKGNINIVYELERFPTANTIEFPFLPISVFSIGEHLYFNTYGGIYILPYGDPTYPIQYVIGSGKLYFSPLYIKTIKEYNGLIYGVTNKGFRYFDGKSFSIDLSQHINVELTAIKRGASSDFRPNAVIVFREGIRNEYQLSYRDLNISTTNHNRVLVLNLDSIVIESNQSYQAAWEIWSGGFSNACANSSNGIFKAQHTATIGHVSIESGYSLKNCLSNTGAFITTLTPKRSWVKSRTFIADIAAIVTWNSIYVLSQLSASANILLGISDQSDKRASGTLLQSGGNPIVLDTESAILPFILSAENPICQRIKLPMTARGKTAYIEFEQTSDDQYFQVLDIQLSGVLERNSYS